MSDPFQRMSLRKACSSPICSPSVCTWEKWMEVRLSTCSHWSYFFFIERTVAGWILISFCESDHDTSLELRSFWKKFKCYDYSLSETERVIYKNSLNHRLFESRRAPPAPVRLWATAACPVKWGSAPANCLGLPPPDPSAYQHMPRVPFWRSRVLEKFTLSFRCWQIDWLQLYDPNLLPADWVFP
jgi:hypothetical protein